MRWLLVVALFAACGASGDEPTDLSAVDAGAEVALEVPAGTLGFTVIVQGDVGPDDALGVQSLTAPDGTEWVIDFADALASGPSLLGEPGAGVAAARVPLVDDRAATVGALPAGRWKIRLGGISGSAKASERAPFEGLLHGTVAFLTTRDGLFHGGALDLDLYIPDGLDTSDVDAMLDIAFPLVSRLFEIDRGEVRRHTIPARFLQIRDQATIDDANRLAESSPSAAVILTGNLMPDGEISGIVNCLPSAAGVGGTACSAAIVSMRDGPLWQTAATMIHELGHFTGLEHSTEFDLVHDRLSDTPKCEDMSKTALRSCLDRENLMFPSADIATSEDTIEVSETQRAILRSSAIVRVTNR